MTTEYYINMKDGRVIGGTSETAGNILYRKIDISWALAIRDKKVTPQKVIELVNAKMGIMPYSEWTEGMRRLNVRSSNLKMEEIARGELADAEESNDKGVLGEFSGTDAKSAKTVATVAEAKAETTKAKVNL